MAAVDVVAPQGSIFSEEKFIKDIVATSEEIGAPYNVDSLKQVMSLYGEYFKEGVCMWRTTDRPGDIINYRFVLHRRVDTLQRAIDAGMVPQGAANPMIALTKQFGDLFEGDTEEWCDFHPTKGLAKNWIFLRKLRPVDAVLNCPDVPEVIRAHGPTFHALGLDEIRIAAVDYHNASMNLYFAAPGPITLDQATKYVNTMLGEGQCDPPTAEEFEDMKSFLKPNGWSFTVTMDTKTGVIGRVGFYGLHNGGRKVKTFGPKLAKYLAEHPCYDSHRSSLIAWSYGLNNSKYQKVESSYTGEFEGHLRNVKAPFS